jgi:hypothetical protein
VEFAEGQHAAAALGEGLDGLGEKLEFLVMTGGFGDAGPIIKDGQEVDLCYAVDGDNLAAAEIVEGGVAGGGEKVGLGGAERRLLTGLEESGVSLLHEVVDIEVRGEFGAEVGAQLGFVRLDFFGKPAGGPGVRRGHGVPEELQPRVANASRGCSRRVRENGENRIFRRRRYTAKFA